MSVDNSLCCSLEREHLHIHDLKHQCYLGHIDSYHPWAFHFTVKPDGKQLALMGEDYTIKIFERQARYGQFECVHICTEDVDTDNSLRYTNEGTRLLGYTCYGRREKISLISWDTDTYGVHTNKKLICAEVLNQKPDPEAGLEKYTDDNCVFLRIKNRDHRDPGEETGILQIRRTDDLRVISSFPIESIYAACRYHPDGKHVLVSSDDREIGLYEIETGKCIQIGHSDSRICSIRYSKDGKYIAVLLRGGVEPPWEEKACLLDRNTWECVAEWPAFFRGSANIFRFSHNSKYLFYLTAINSAAIWDIEAGKQIAEMRHQKEIRGAAFAPDDSWIATGSYDGTIKIWDAKTFQCIQVLTNAFGLYIQGMDLRQLAPGADFTEEDKELLRLYGARIY